MPSYSKTFITRWADLDPNRHLRHSAYADYCTQVRFCFLNENGFDMERLAKLRLGPVVFREETVYKKEVGMGDSISIDMTLEELGTGGNWTIRHDISRGDGQIAAVHRIEGAWLELQARKLALPPQELIDLLGSLLAPSET